MRPVHVLHVIDGLGVGGAETMLRDIVQGLPKRRYRVSVCYSSPGPLTADLEALGVAPIRVRRLARLDPGLFVGMCRVIRRERPQIVHTHLVKSDVHGRPAARLCGVPVVVSTLHSCDTWARNPALGRIYGWTARFADRLFAVSEEVREFAIRQTLVAPDKVRTIPNAIVLERFTDQEGAGKTVRRELGIPEGVPLIGMVARLSREKDHGVFLRAATQVLRAFPAARFLIIGDGPARGACVAEAARLAVGSAVIFCGLRRDIPAVLGALDLFVLSSRREGLPVAVLEAMASALPVVATAVDGLAGIVEDGVTGWLVPSGDPAALARACLRVLEDPGLGRRMGQAGRARVARGHGSEGMIRSLVAQYEELLGRRGWGSCP